MPGRARRAGSDHLHAAADRVPSSVERLHADLGWRARYDIEAAVTHFDDWWRR